MNDVQALIQARMSSVRLPGKMLAPLKDLPVIDRVIAIAAGVVGISNTIVVTSTDPSDDPLEAYLSSSGVRVFRGDLENVFRRFVDCLTQYPCCNFFRICGDSPFLDGNLLREALRRMEQHPQDIITNVFPRTFPKGQSVELIDAECFLSIDQDALDDEQREHVTKVFYRQPGAYRIGVIRALNDMSDHPGWCVDTADDLKRLEATAQRPQYKDTIAPL